MDNPILPMSHKFSTLEIQHHSEAFDVEVQNIDGTVEI